MPARTQESFKNVSEHGRGRLVPGKRQAGDRARGRGRPRPFLAATSPEPIARFSKLDENAGICILAASPDAEPTVPLRLGIFMRHGVPMTHRRDGPLRAPGFTLIELLV